MNNNAIMLRNQMANNPRVFAQNALRSGYFKNDEKYVNALQVVMNGDEKAAKEMVENICKEHHVSVDDTMAQYKSQYGIR